MNLYLKVHEVNSCVGWFLHDKSNCEENFCCCHVICVSEVDIMKTSPPICDISAGVSLRHPQIDTAFSVHRKSKKRKRHFVLGEGKRNLYNSALVATTRESDFYIKLHAFFLQSPKFYVE